MPKPIRAIAGVKRGVATILMTVFAMALADAYVKFASADLTLWQIWVLRSALVLPLLLTFGRARLWTDRFGWVLLRSLALTAMYLGIYAALPLLDLSVVAAALYTAPLFIAALSAFALGEPITARQRIALATGFAGVLLIVRPGAEGFTSLTLLPVGAALLYAVAAVVTRAKCADVPARTLATWLNVTLLVAGGVASLVVAVAAGNGADDAYPFLFGVWQTMGPPEWLTIVVLAGLMLGIGIGLAKAYQSPSPQVIASFDYAFLIFAAFWGWVFFGEAPDLETVAGMTLIAAGGVAVASARPRAAPQPG